MVPFTPGDRYLTSAGGRTLCQTEDETWRKHRDAEGGEDRGVLKGGSQGRKGDMGAKREGMDAGMLWGEGRMQGETGI